MFLMIIRHLRDNDNDIVFVFVLYAKLTKQVNRCEILKSFLSNQV